MAGKFNLKTSVSDLKTLEDLREFRNYLNSRMFWATSESEVSKINRKMTAVDKKISRLA